MTLKGILSKTRYVARATHGKIISGIRSLRTHVEPWFGRQISSVASIARRQHVLAMPAAGLVHLRRLRSDAISWTKRRTHGAPVFTRQHWLGLLVVGSLLVLFPRVISAPLSQDQSTTAMTLFTALALLLSFMSYSSTAKLSKQTLTLQQSDFRLRHRPLLLFLVEKIEIDRTRIVAPDMPANFTAAILTVPIENASHTPMFSLTVAAHLRVTDGGVYPSPIRAYTFLGVGAGEQIPVNIPYESYQNTKEQVKTLTLSLVARYEGLSDLIPGWFESSILLHVTPRAKAPPIIRAAHLHHKAFWDEPLPTDPIPTEITD